MCGLFGWQFTPGSVANWQKAVLASALATHMDQRGGDSWGYYIPDQDKLVHGLGNMAGRVKAARLAVHDCLFAHTRNATTGTVNKANAHPFRFDNIVGAHNGMVSNHAELNQQYDRWCAVDSEHIFLHLQEGLDLGEVEAYGTIEFCFPSEPDRVWLCAFNDGDLTVYKVAGGIVWASTRKAVRQALHLAGLKGTALEVVDSQLYCAQGGRLWKSRLSVNFSSFSWLGTGVNFRNLTS